MPRITISEGHRALLVRRGRWTEFLRPGRHFRWLWPGDTIEHVGPREGARAWEAGIERILPDSDARIFDVPDAHALLVMRHGQPFKVLTSGRHVVWLFDALVETKLVRIDALRSEIPVGFWPLCPEFVRSVVVHPYERAVIYDDGVQAEVLETGCHGLSPWRRTLEVLKVDMREQELQVAGQELITRDKVSLRLNLVLKYRVVDAVASLQATTALRDALYAEVQLVSRSMVAGVGVDELLEQRVELSKTMVTTLSDRAMQWGVSIARLELKDVILPGDMKTLLNQVIEAEKRAVAQNILRREETAATRSLANTARLLEANPTLARLKEIEAWKDMAQSIPNLTVVVSPKELQSLALER